MDAGIEDERIHEMDWWETRVLSRPGSKGPIKTTFICCPAQHSSGACSMCTIVCLYLAGTYASATPFSIYVRIQVVESMINERRCGPVGLQKMVTAQCIMLGETISTILSGTNALMDCFSDTGYMTEKGPCPAFKGEGKSHEIMWPRFTDSVSRNWREARPV